MLKTAASGDSAALGRVRALLPTAVQRTEDFFYFLEDFAHTHHLAPPSASERKKEQRKKEKKNRRQRHADMDGANAATPTPTSTTEDRRLALDAPLAEHQLRAALVEFAEDAAWLSDKVPLPRPE